MSEEDGWDDLRPPQPPRSPRPRVRRRLLLLIGAVLLGALLTAWAAYRQLDRRAAEVASGAESDVLAAHALLTAAALDEDVDLFSALLSDEDTFWRDKQLDLLARDLWLDRGAMGLWLDASQPAAEVHVTLSPDLSRALIVDQLAYEVEWQSGVTDTVWLSRTAVYKREQAQWRLAPLPVDQAFWGAWQTVEGTRIILTFAGREAAVGRRLAADLDSVLVQLCRETAVPCRPNQKLHLRLSREASSPLILNENYRMLNVASNVEAPTIYRMDLPAPTLLGMPAGEVAYQALLQGYANWVTAVLAARASRELAASDQFVVAQLAQIGRQLPPPPGYLPAQARAEPPIPWPEQDILVACQLDNRSSLWRYEPATDSWEDLLAAAGRLRPFLNLSLVWPLPDDDGLLLQVRRYEAGEVHSQIVRWIDGDEQVVVDDAVSYEVVTWLTPRMSPDGRYILLYQTQQADRGILEQLFYTLDLGNCAGEACGLRTVAGVPYWSPGGARSLIVEAGQWPSDLYLGDETGEIAQWIDEGWAPFWIDEQTFGYVRPAEPGGDYVAGALLEVVLASVDAPYHKRVVLRTGDLLAALSGDAAIAPEAPIRLYINDVAVDQTSGALALSVVTWGESGQSLNGQHYLLYDPATDALSAFLDVSDSSGYPMSFTRNGRFFAALTTDSSHWTLYLHDVRAGTTATYPLQPTIDFFYPVIDWSANEEWLVLAEDRALRLVAPAHDFSHTVFHTLSGCRTAVWINQ